MKSDVIFVLAFVALTSAKSLRFAPEQRLDSEWELFKKAFDKDYKSREEEILRRIVWEENLRIIQKHNYEADLGKHTYRLGVNNNADLTNAEFRKMLLGLRVNATHKSTGSSFLPPSNMKPLPASVDWRTKGYVTPVKNQLRCTCWAFSATGSLEGQHFKKTGQLVSLSEQQLVDCSGSFGNKGCRYGQVANAFRYIKANGGIDTEQSYPYNARDNTCHFKPADVGATCTGYVDVSPGGDEQTLKVAVATVGPISVGIDASHSSFQLYQSGVYNEPNCSSIMLDHDVLAVGYGVQDGQDYWLVKNSWGTYWGMQGYIMMSRNKKNQCGIATTAIYPLV